jgi:hypothetical protein
MNLKSFFVISIISVSFLSLESSFRPVQASSSWVENRTHCVWRRGSFGMKYKSCSAQIRHCENTASLDGGGAVCSPWRNRW